MSASPVTKLRDLSDQQLQEIAGGDCSIGDIQEALTKLQDSYDTLVDFTSYVIGRVAGEQ